VDMMSEVIKRGTARGIARLLTFPAAGKTGTSNKYRDAWFVGYTDDLCAAVWAGNLDNSPTASQAGGAVAAPVWADFMVKAEPIMIAARQAGGAPEVEEITPPKPRRAEPPSPEGPAGEPAVTPGDNPEQNVPGAAEDTSGVVEKQICSESGLLAGPNCRDAITVTYDLRHGDAPPDRVCDIHNRAPPPRPPPERVRAGRQENGDEMVEISICAITKKLATPYCPVVQNVMIKRAEAPTESCPRHGRR